jgi:hypothetical protein
MIDSLDKKMYELSMRGPVSQTLNSSFYETSYMQL